MSEFDKLLKEKIKRLEEIPLTMQSAVLKQQSKMLKQIQEQIAGLDIVDGVIQITEDNINKISVISDELKTVFLSKEYTNAVKEFATQFSTQAVLNNKLIEAGFGAIESSIAAKAYINIAKKTAIESLVGAPIDKEFIKPIQSLLTDAVVNGASYSDTMSSIGEFISGGKNGSKLERYAAQITSDSFAMADASYTSIVSDFLGADWYLYSGTEMGTTRCFCAERVGNFYHYKEYQDWGNGKDLGKCDLGNGTWDGEIDGTNSATIFTNRGGWNCQHFFMPVSEAIVSKADIARVKAKGYL